jgi:hypothetical protein
LDEAFAAAGAACGYGKIREGGRQFGAAVKGSGDVGRALRKTGAMTASRWRAS